MGNMTETWTREPVEDSATSHGYPVTELNTGVSFRAYPANFSSNYTSLRSYRSSLTYVTGSHAFKCGMTLQEGPADTDIWTNKDTFLTVRNGAAVSACRSARRRTRRTNGSSPIWACTRRTPGRSSG